MDSPDDTIAPADEDANADFIARLDLQIAGVSAEWQTYSMLLSKAAVGGGSKANFTNYFGKIAGLRTQWQVENTQSFETWGYDADNALVIDNFKLERLYAGLGSIRAQRSGGNIVLTWTAGAGAKLQASTKVEGPYAEVSGAASGYSTPMSGQARFFRLAQ